MRTETKSIRVFHVISRLNIGGAAAQVILTVARLKEAGYDCRLLSGRLGADEGDMSYLADQYRVAPEIIPELGRSLNPFKDLVAIFKIYRLFRREKPDIVHTHTAKAGFIGRLAAHLAGVPVILHTYHGHVFHGYFSRWQTAIFLKLERFAAKISTTIITLSEGLKRELWERYRITTEDRITVLPLGFDLEKLKTTARGQGIFRRRLELPSDIPLVGIIGRMAPIKNHELFVQAAEIVKNRLPATHFIVIGEGETRERIEKLVATLNLQNVFHFIGWQKDLAPIYSDLNLSVVCSFNEGTPVSLIESLAAGCPVVSTAVGGVPDLLEEGRLGRMVPPEDASALAAAILETLLISPDLAGVPERIQKRFSLDLRMQALTRLYQDLLEGARKSNRSFSTDLPS
ncbi:MAG: glycosyltransferase family 4 protein [Candidatus Eisenbacteria bacterium]|nr:glycosyltransferase family 4 protein [Candidatus Eisenbacteria bacterium]